MTHVPTSAATPGPRPDECLRGQPVRSALLVSCLVVLAAFFWSAPAVAASETFDLIIWPYCEPGDFCGFWGEQALINHALDAVQVMNEEWMIAGISFRPTVMPIDSSNPQYHFTTNCKDDRKYCDDLTTVCNDASDCPGTCVERYVCDDLTTECMSDPLLCLTQGLGSCQPLNKQRREHWRDNVAAAHPNAISLMLTPGTSTCCSNIARPFKQGYTMFGIYCHASFSVKSAGTVWSHEMGHHWCLEHTFTKSDYLDSFPSEPDHDGDAGTVSDTPADPCGIEGTDHSGRLCTDGTPCNADGTCPPGSGDCDGYIVNQWRDFCDPEVLSAGVTDGSPRTTYCDSECWRCPAGTCNTVTGTLSPIPYDPDEYGAMTYYGQDCRGPVVVNGQRYEAFSPGSVARIQDCRAAVPVRTALPDVCPSPDGDADHDGICNSADLCPVTADTAQKDFDGDGYGDACDLCPSDPAPTGDMDGDGEGDICDTDRDDDGCDNNKDQHPDSAWDTVGYTQYIGCFVGGKTDTAFEGDNYDAAGEPVDNQVPNCRDLDDDNDGFCDEDGPEAASVYKGVPPGGCVPGPGFPPRDPCPQTPGLGPCEFIEPGPPCPPIWLACLGTGCEEFYLKFIEVINPVDTLIVDTFQIFNETLFVVPPTGMTPSELAVLIQDAGTGGARDPASPRRIEIWSRDPDEFVALVVEYDPETAVDMGEFRYGPIVAITPTSGGLEVETRYAMGMNSGPLPADADGDGRPDWRDNCRLAGNFRQTDADQDGFGNLCDADLDNDNLVTLADLEAVEACLGADLSVVLPISEPNDPDADWESDGFEQPGPTPLALRLSSECPPANLNDDGYVDDGDVALVQGMLDSVPGPSSSVNRKPVAIAGPDQEGECGAPVTVDGCASHDVDGHELTYAWESSSCVVLDPDACATEVVCNAGDNLASLVVNDGTADSVPSDAGVTVSDCVASGAIPPTLTVSRSPVEGTLLLSWDLSCLASDDYGIYQGTIGNWYSHVAIQCDDGDGSALSETILESAASTYFLVAPHGQTESPAGLDSDGQPRPQAPAGQRCATVQAPAGCEP